MLDLVLNHVATEHEWAAKAARPATSSTGRTSTCSPTAPQVDEFEATLPEVFPDFAPGNFTWDDELEGWVWTTFNAFQWDVNWANPDVLYEYADIMLFLANLGVEVLRLDAIAFMWKRLGYQLPESARGPRHHPGAPRGRPDRLPRTGFQGRGDRGAARIWCSTWGRARHHGKVSDIAYHNSLMVQIWSMLASGDARLAVEALRRRCRRSRPPPRG